MPLGLGGGWLKAKRVPAACNRQPARTHQRRYWITKEECLPQMDATGTAGRRAGALLDFGVWNRHCPRSDGWCYLPKARRRAVILATIPFLT
jgi:hypothetical protein